MAEEEQHQRAGASGRRGRLARSSEGGARQRSRSVYAVLAVGIVALLSLLLIIYFSSGRDLPEQPICTTVDAESARQAVLEGRITRVTIAYDDTVIRPSAPKWGPVLARLDYSDGQCANLPQGIVNQDDIYLLLGTITAFNDITENTQVEITYDRETSLQPGLFTVPTPLPTPTEEPAATPVPSPSPSPEPTPTTEPDVPVGPILLPGSPEASPELTPGL